MNDVLLTTLLVVDSALRLATPLIFAALGGLLSERAGVIDIGLEGKMLASAFAAAVVATHTGNPLLALGAGVVAAMALGLVHAFACISQRGSQVVSGMAINLLAAGLTATLGMAWYQRGGQTPALEVDARFQALTWPGVDVLEGVPFLGIVYRELISGHNALVYGALLTAAVVWWLLFKSRFGLYLRAVGENPAAVDTAGLSVTRLRYGAVLACSALCGAAGCYLSVAQNAGFIPDMTAGRGYMALAAMIFAQWRPVTALGTCLLFGVLDASAVRFQGAVLPGIGSVPVQFIQALPYVLTVVLLAGFFGRAHPPAALGVPYSKDR